MCISTVTISTAAVLSQDEIEMKRQNLQRRSVSFGYVEEVEALPHHHFDDEQAAQMWYSKVELKRFRKQIKKILKGESCMEESMDCYRGLEVFENSNRSNRYQHLVIPVLQLQDSLWDMNVEDPIGLQSFASSLNRKCIEEAIVRGLTDSTEACKVHQETFDAVTVESFFDELAHCTCEHEMDEQAARSA